MWRGKYGNHPSARVGQKDGSRMIDDVVTRGGFITIHVYGTDLAGETHDLCDSAAQTDKCRVKIADVFLQATGGIASAGSIHSRMRPFSSRG